MKTFYFALFIAVILSNLGCHAQNNNKMENNPLLCVPEKGACTLPNNEQKDIVEAANLKSLKKPLKVVYYTDPICSACWGIEPQLRKLKLEYGHCIDLEYRMGGLLPDWSYNSGGISQPSDVAKHWDEMTRYYDMPIDGDVWLEDPLPSSYPPSIAFKAAQLQSNEKAILFLREIREMIFLQKKNITKWEFLALAAQKVGLDAEQLKVDYEGKAKELFNEDLKLGRELGVRGFPSVFFSDSTGKTVLIYGLKPYTFYENTVLALAGEAVKNNYKKSWQFVFSKYASLTAKEFAELTQTPRNECEKVLDNLYEKGILTKMTLKSGSIWKLRSKD